MADSFCCVGAVAHQDTDRRAADEDAFRSGSAHAASGSNAGSQPHTDLHATTRRDGHFDSDAAAQCDRLAHADHAGICIDHSRRNWFNFIHRNTFIGYTCTDYRGSRHRHHRQHPIHADRNLACSSDRQHRFSGHCR